jgi:uncharacterized OB-fold protein
MSDVAAPPAIPKPVPQPEGELNAQFWEHCALEKLCFQRCDDCGRWRHLPRFMCPDCGSPAWSWHESSGRGRLFTWTVSHRSPLPAFAAELPFAVAVVEMEEGVRMVAGLRELPLESLALDLPVELVFERVSEEMALPYFRPV